MAKYLIVDPPSGWLYNFPLVLAKLPEKAELRNIDIDSYSDIYRDLLRLNNYPEKDIESALNYSRYWINKTEW